MTTPGSNPSRTLPDRPSLRRLKDEAKSRVKAGEFAKLSDAQFAIAHEFGFASWPKLSRHVEAVVRANLEHAASDNDDLVVFSAAVRDNRHFAAEKMLEAHPEFVDARVDPGTWMLTGKAFAQAIAAGPRTDQTQTALHHVSIHGWTKMARVLLDHGADVNAVGFEGNMGVCTSIVLAAWEGGFDTLRLLLEAGADATGEYGKAALSTAAGHKGFDRFNLLIEHGAPVDVSLCIGIGFVDRVVEMIEDDPTLLNKPDHKGLTPLQTAVEVMRAYSPGDEPARKTVDALLQRGAKVDLFSAAGMEDPRMLREQIQANRTQVNARLPDGRTPLFFAAMNDRSDAISLLLAAGADPNVRYHGYGAEYHPTPLAVAARHDYTETCRRLLEGGAEPIAEAMYEAVWRNKDTECVRVMLDHGADVTASIHNTALLHWPCMIGNATTVKLLIERGADVNAQATGDWPLKTPLHFAAERGHDGCVQALLEAGADPNRVDKNGRTPLDEAVRHYDSGNIKGHERTADLLRRHMTRE